MMRECKHMCQEEWILMADDHLIFFKGIFKGRHLADGDHGGRLGRLHAHHPQLAGHHVNRHGPPHGLDHLAYKQGGPHHLSRGLFLCQFWWSLGQLAPPQGIGNMCKPWQGCSQSSYGAFRWGLCSQAWDGQWTLCGGSCGFWASYTSCCSEHSSYMGSLISTSTTLWRGGDSVDSFILDRVIIIQLDGVSSLKTSCSVNVVDYMASLSSQTHSASWHDSPTVGGLAFSAQCCSGAA